jgi:acyl-coenzyme A synthetase/AMP-(fatty) acid ligase
VAPATVEAILMGHPQITDCGVIGVHTSDGNELVRWGYISFKRKFESSPGFFRAYVAPKDSALLKSPTFATEIQEWVKARASKYQQLRGGMQSFL